MPDNTPFDDPINKAELEKPGVGLVVEVLPDLTGDIFGIVINKGKRDGIEIGDSFSVYELGEEMFDPATKERLGRLELSKGRGTVDSIQEKMSVLLSSKKTRRLSNALLRTTLTIGGHWITVPAAFDRPEVGDFVKPS